jgi:iduronate 2-sulfatase
VLSALEAHGYAGNTIVSFWGDHGWQLGEHGEWCKHTNFDLATNAPMFIHIPGMTDKGVTTSTPTEYLDLMPTLAEAAMGLAVPACPKDAHAARNVTLCTHGVSLLPLISHPDTPVKPAAYSQYPRGYVKPGDEASGMVELDWLSSDEDDESVAPSPSMCLTRHCTMGYSMLTTVNGTEYRYTEWVDFNTKVSGGPDWERNVGTELYNHATDALENVNRAQTASKALLDELSRLLRAHPVWASSAAA